MILYVILTKPGGCFSVQHASGKVKSFRKHRTADYGLPTAILLLPILPRLLKLNDGGDVFRGGRALAWWNKSKKGNCWNREPMSIESYLGFKKTMRHCSHAPRYSDLGLYFAVVQ